MSESFKKRIERLDKSHRQFNRAINDILVKDFTGHGNTYRENAIARLFEAYQWALEGVRMDYNGSGKFDENWEESDERM